MTPTRSILHVALVEPDIAPNVGTIARLCAANFVKLHLIGRLGFRLNDRALRRAGLDYWPEVDIAQSSSWHAFRQAHPQLRCIAFSSKASDSLWGFTFLTNDCLVFGSETKGLPAELAQSESIHARLVIPMVNKEVRCLNVALSAGIAVYEALRQIQFNADADAYSAFADRTKGAWPLPPALPGLA